MKIKILHDVYNISNRIKNIEKNYYIVYNTSSKKFEIHNSKQTGSSYCLTLPYEQLDERTLNFVCSTNSENIERILNEIEKNNKRMESAEKSKALSCVCEQIEQEIKWK